MMRSPEHLRSRAQDCLNLSKGVRTDVDRTILEDIAFELNAAAARIEAEQSRSLAASRQLSTHCGC